MDWNQLLSAKRWGAEARYVANQADARSEFQRDYDRIIFSSPFRRLQNKTQVFPLPGSVFVHNRLTHSLEVASVGKSLGRIFYSKLKEADKNLEDRYPLISEIGDMIGAASLAHDMGNPAFGHSGESAISQYFTQGAGSSYQNKVTEQQRDDLVNFEGNANALRMLTHHYPGKGLGGFQLTYSTIAAIVKYPCASLAGHDKTKIHRKKYGFFQSEQEGFTKIATELGLIRDQDDPLSYKRHPLVYLVEAADDICYSIVDLEDAHRLKILTYREVEDILLPLCDDVRIPVTLAKMDDVDAKVGYLRARSINQLVRLCSDLFYDEQDAILSGTFNAALMDRIPEPYRGIVKNIAKVSVKKIYNYSQVVQIEVAGYQVMGGLLEEFIPAYVQRSSKYHEKLVELIPKQFLTESQDDYSKIQTVLDFVSGMTDLYAVELFRKIKGISFPSMS